MNQATSRSELHVSANPAADQIREQVGRILASRLFARSERLCRFVRFCVDLTLDGRSDELKEQLIGVEVFDRRGDYDPRTDPIVRVEARRLRAKLKAYYASQGKPDSLLIELPKGAYVPAFRTRNTTAAAIPHGRPEPVSSTPGERSIAVLPFTNLSPEAGTDYFSDGLAEELIHLLTRMPRLRVVAWNSMSQLRGRDQDLAGLRRQLNVTTVLRGSVRRTAGRVRVNAQLIDAESGAYLWSEAYDRQLENVLAIQEEMARAIVNTLRLSLAWRGGGAARRAPNVECYNLCLQGRFHANKRTPEGLLQSVQCFEQAVKADETSAVAYAGLADAYSLMSDYGMADPTEIMPNAKMAAEKALQLDANSAEAHVSLAFIRSTFEWKWNETEAIYRRAIELNPGYSRAHHWLSSDFLAMVGRFAEAKAEAEVARSLDPLSAIIVDGLGFISTLRRDYPTALAEYQQLLELDPLFFKGYSSLGRLYFLLGRYEEAISCFEKARSLAGDVPSILAGLAQTLAVAGFVWEARALLDQLHAMQKTRWVPSSCFAIVQLGLGDHQAALDHLEAACDKRERTVTGFKVHPLFDPLRSEHRFQSMLERIGFLTVS